MGWGGPEYVDPKERKAAEEAATAMEAQRALADAHTSALCEAIRDGFATLASAIAAAAGAAHEYPHPPPPGSRPIDLSPMPFELDDVDDLLQNDDPDK